MLRTLPVKHYHIIFTVPHQLNGLCLHNQRLYYDLLFAATWHTLRSFGYTHYGVESGAVAVLHTCLSAVQDFGRRRDRTCHCIRIFIASFHLQATRWMAGGRISGLREVTSIRLPNLARPLNTGSWTASNGLCENRENVSLRPTAS